MAIQNHHGQEIAVVISLSQASKVISLLLILTTSLSFWSCAIFTTGPKYEMAFAESAFTSAKEANAAALAPNLYSKAELYYLKAKSSYRRKYFNKAKEYAILCKEYSERAENSAAEAALSANNSR